MSPPGVVGNFSMLDFASVLGCGTGVEVSVKVEVASIVVLGVVCCSGERGTAGGIGVTEPLVEGFFEREGWSLKAMMEMRLVMSSIDADEVNWNVGESWRRLASASLFFIQQRERHVFDVFGKNITSNHGGDTLE